MQVKATVFFDIAKIPCTYKFCLLNLENGIV